MKTRHDTKTEIETRVSNEASMAPEHDLPMAAPARLRGHRVAAEVWRRLMRGWAEIEAQVVTRLDMDLLVDYCILMEQLTELDRMRKVTYGLWLELGEAHEKLKVRVVEAEKEADEARKASKEAGRKEGGEEESAALAEQAGRAANYAVILEDKAVEAAAKCVDAFEAVVKLDGRVDRKRDLLLKWRQSLYLTPRARAGVAPSKKEEEEPLDPMDVLLGNVTSFVNGDGK